MPSYVFISIGTGSVAVLELGYFAYRVYCRLTAPEFNPDLSLLHLRGVLHVLHVSAWSFSHLPKKTVGGLATQTSMVIYVRLVSHPGRILLPCALSVSDASGLP